MPSEVDVIDAVRDHLVGEGWTQVSRATVHQTGVDLLVCRGGTTLSIEAKGEGSCKPDTRRFGQSFTNNQVKSHVARAVLTALQVVSAGGQAALALPDNAAQRHEVGRVATALQRLGIPVLWMTPDRAVTVDEALQGETQT